MKLPQNRSTLEAGPTPTEQLSEAPIPTASPISPWIVAKVRPSVVRIVTNRGAGSDLIFQMGFPTPGSGDTALVMTNYQVIENASRIDATANDSTTLTGTVLDED